MRLYIFLSLITSLHVTCLRKERECGRKKCKGAYKSARFFDDRRVSSFDNRHLLDFVWSHNMLTDKKVRYLSSVVTKFTCFVSSHVSIVKEEIKAPPALCSFLIKQHIWEWLKENRFNGGRESRDKLVYLGSVLVRAL